MKKILLVIVVVVIGIFLFLKYSNSELENQVTEKVAKTVINTVLEVSKIDASALAGIADKLEKSCAKNKYGLSENDCILAIRNRKDICTQQTAQKYPGQLSDTDKMQTVVSHYVDCLFQSP